MYTDNWLVVIFTNENLVSVIPLKWYVHSTNECYWPPGNYNRKNTVDAIRYKEDPGFDWKPFPCKVLGEYADYKIAQLKAKKAENSDVLTSFSKSSEKTGRGLRLKFRTRRIDESDDTDGDIQEEEDEDEYPNPPPKIISKINSTLVSKNVQNQRLVVPSEVTPPRLINKNATEEFLNTLISTSAAFQNQVIRELNILRLQVDDINKKSFVSPRNGKN
ncbi:hypothetical protein FQR65_LT02012 [Abscondita terminalis]|nr:hypothetical protein FQR65_LT02012 [Abscondita terminalis]